ncbi:hypothetical protein Tco_1058430 [Tanacetum coccineum]|uniref:Uncharacterized protein n=1 Tax=Tanacetum coccineum TaxID=301880 RepID=A0ABQ5H8R2_9ASTR
MVDLLDNNERRRNHSGKGMIRKAIVIGNALDAVIRIISFANVQSLHRTRNNRPLSGVLGVIVKMSDNASSLDDDSMQIEYNN